MKQLFINGYEIDLGAAEIATSYQAGDVQDLTTRRFTHSNRFIVPFTENNIKRLGFINKIGSLSSVPYTTQDARLLNNGVNIMPGAQAVIEGVEEKGFSIELYAGARAFFEQLGTKVLADLDLSAHNIAWTASTMDAARAATTGVVAPVMSYGKFDTGSPKNIKSQFYLPSVYYHTVLEKIIAEAGYTKAGAIFTEDKYLKTIIPYSRSNTNYASAHNDRRMLVAAAGGAQAISVANTPVKFPTISKIGSLVSYTDEQRYNRDLTRGAYGLKVTAMLQVTITGSGSASFIIQTNSGSWIAPFSGVLGLGTHYFVLESFTDNDWFTAGGWFEVRFQVETLAPTATINYGLLKVEADPAINWIAGISVNDILPDMTQRDFVKDFAVRNGLLFDEKNGVLECKSFKEIITNRAGAKDWTSKRVVAKETIKHELAGRYAQTNYFKYTEESTERVPVEFANGELLVANTNLELLKDYYTSPFGLTSTENIGTIFMAIVPAYNADNASIVSIPELDNDPKLRLLLVRSKYSFEPAVRYNAIDRSDYLVAYFDDPGQVNTLVFQQYLDTNYTELVAALQKLKLVGRRYILNLIDMSSLTPFTLVYDGGHYFLINKITNYQYGKSVLVELLKV